MLPMPFIMPRASEPRPEKIKLTKEEAKEAKSSALGLVLRHVQSSVYCLPCADTHV